ncbi:hypothetical protein [Aeromonas finlandensis]|nr:hypothetical protein [Aeromonas finlandensis]
MRAIQGRCSAYGGDYTNPIHGEAVVQIFKSLDGDAHITSITPI